MTNCTYQSQGLSLAERQSRVKEIVRGLRYGTGNYIDNIDHAAMLQ